MKLPHGTSRGDGSAPGDGSFRVANRVDLETSILYRTPARRRLQGAKIKTRLASSATVPALSEVVGKMQDAFGTRNFPRWHISSGDMVYRLVWEFTFDYETPWIYNYFYMRRLFDGKALDARYDCLGPDWEVPDDLVDLSENEIDRLLSREEIEAVSAAERQVVRVGSTAWVEKLEEMLRQAHRHAFYRTG